MKFNFKFSTLPILFLLLLDSPSLIHGKDITNLVFDHQTDGYIPAAFGDFNSDELTDVFMLCDEDRSVQIFLASESVPLLQAGPKCTITSANKRIVSVVPGDFDGDAFMDVMLVVKDRKNEKETGTDVYVYWGDSSSLNCTTKGPVIQDLIGEPMALDYNQDMIVDLFGVNSDTERVFYIFKRDRSPPTQIKMDLVTNSTGRQFTNLRAPHSHAYLDLNNDFCADLFLVAQEKFEVWKGSKSDGFEFDRLYDLDTLDTQIIGQSLFLDFELKGHLNHILPVCSDDKCSNSSIMIRSGDKFYDLEVNFKDIDGVLWGFVVPEEGDIYSKAITLRGGDFNMDGYPDLLVTLSKKVPRNRHQQYQTFLLENVAASDRKGFPFARTFSVRWHALAPFTNGTIVGAFYDFYQDGVLDVLMVERTEEKKYRTVAFRNTLDYDANFIKVIVLSGLENAQKKPEKLTPFGRTKKTYGSNLPGPRIEYITTTQEGLPQHGATAQLPQSAYSPMQLPYSIFGLGRTPNFVDTLVVGLSNYSHDFTQIIPNSQMIVVPQPLKDPAKWKSQLFVTPSKLILMSVFALGGTCLVIMFIILGLYIKEKREDKAEKLAEAHRFHFDAM